MNQPTDLTITGFLAGGITRVASEEGTTNQTTAFEFADHSQITITATVPTVREAEDLSEGAMLDTSAQAFRLLNYFCDIARSIEGYAETEEGLNALDLDEEDESDHEDADL